MKRNELLELRRLVDEEIKRRERIKELLSNPLVIEYLKITNTDYRLLDEKNTIQILNQILPNFKITKTNGIFVCTCAYYIDYDICYEETNYYSRDVDINSKYAEHKIYKDIESGLTIKGNKEDNNRYGKPLISDFEENNIVLNPKNTSLNGNGYKEVQMDFFTTSIKDGQAKAKKLILNKYPRI